MRTSNRSERRHQLERIKKARKLYWGYHRHWGTDGKQSMSAKQLGKVSQNPHPCSCPGCGNVRRHIWASDGTGLTRQEMCHVIDLKEGIDEVTQACEESAEKDAS